MIRLLMVAFDEFSEELSKRVADAGYSDIRPGHGCVFGNIDAQNGSRLTELADRALMTKQSVGEVTSDLEQRGYVERVPDPADGRAKLVRPTAKGRAAVDEARAIAAEIERDIAGLIGAERLRELKGLLADLHDALWPDG